MIKLTNVIKIYSTGEKALDDVSLSVCEGDIFGIVGRSGAGKSTMLKLFGGLDAPTSGGVEILSQEIGTIFQGFNLLMQRSVEKNIAFPLEIGKNLNKKEIKQRCEELAKIVGLGDKLKAYPSGLSGGQKQRVAIARALATSPKILLCDEPTSALDSCTAKEILRLLKDINAKLDTTIVIITHDINVVRAVCNKMVVLAGGKIAEIGATVDVLGNPQSEATKLLLDFNV